MILIMNSGQSPSTLDADRAAAERVLHRMRRDLAEAEGEANAARQAVSALEARAKSIRDGISGFESWMKSLAPRQQEAFPTLEPTPPPPGTGYGSSGQKIGGMEAIADIVREAGRIRLADIAHQLVIRGWRPHTAVVDQADLVRKARDAVKQSVRRLADRDPEFARLPGGQVEYRPGGASARGSRGEHGADIADDARVAPGTEMPY